MISETDRSGKSAASSRVAYRRIGQGHTRKDRKISWKEDKSIKAEILYQTEALMYIFNPGKAQEETNKSR